MDPARAGGRGRSHLPAGENGYNESFHGKLRDELLLNGEIFYTLKEAQIFQQPLTDL